MKVELEVNSNDIEFGEDDDSLTFICFHNYISQIYIIAKQNFGAKLFINNIEQQFMSIGNSKKNIFKKKFQLKKI